MNAGHLSGCHPEILHAYLGAKGDWPRLRNAFKLKTGFTSLCKSHLCPVDDSWHAYNIASLNVIL